MSSKKPKILIAAGGTGGHLFPAQALAQELLEKEPEMELLFAGVGLSANRYFQKEQFAFVEIAGATPFRGKLFQAGKQIFSGVRKSLQLLKKFNPDLVIGFGSFHSFPVLVAAKLMRKKFVLFESNAIPGKVNRLFARWAELTAVHIEHAQKHLKGKTTSVMMPMLRERRKRSIGRAKAQAFFGLESPLPTLLVFGGSQGALSLNKLFTQTAELLSSVRIAFQVIHLIGHKENSAEVQRIYARLKIPACVKEFEKEMVYAWEAADLAICRAGAGTLAELIEHNMPALLIPYPHAADKHQQANALFMQNEVKGARMLLEAELTPDRLFEELTRLIQPETLKKMQKSIDQFKLRERKRELNQLIWEIL